MATEPTRGEVDRMGGATVLEFGASWCPICRAARPLIDRALAGRTDLKYLWIEDGKGKPLGRSFRVKLWPTLIFLRDGQEVARVVRPSAAAEVTDALQRLQSHEPLRSP
jgi:thioredoxin 1